MPHRCRQRRESGLGVDALVVAAQQHVDCMGVAQVVETRGTAPDASNASIPEESLKAAVDAPPGIGERAVGAMDEQWRVPGMWESLPGQQVLPGLFGGTVTKAYEARLAAFRLAHE